MRERDFFLDTQHQVKHILQDESSDSQDEFENLDDMRGIRLNNAMKDMTIGDINLREVIDIEDEKYQIISRISMQIHYKPSTSDSHDQDQQVQN